VHWLFVALIAFSWWSAENHEMEYHRYSGYALLGVVVFRLYWGFFGSATARFAQFVKGPRAIIQYLRGGLAMKQIGHNPLGALSVLGLLLLLLTQIGLGLFAVDIDGIESGPLSHLVSFETGRILADRHETIFNILMVMITLHVGAILFYAFIKRDNLVVPMITGDQVASPELASVNVAAPLVRVVIGVLLAAAVVWAVT
jgi:cytochrome b